jgi:hypothetical protein
MPERRSVVQQEDPQQLDFAPITGHWTFKGRASKKPSISRADQKIFLVLARISQSLHINA